MNRIADGLEGELQAVKAAVAQAILNDLVEKTPVDTSRALSNWRVSAGAIDHWIEAHVPGRKGSTRAASATIAVSNAIDAIARGRPNEALVIFNSVPYIRRLNEGYSAQAPAGFVERAVLIGRSVAKNYKVRLAT